MRLPQLTHLVVGSIYGRVHQIRPKDELVDLTDTDVIDVDLVPELPAPLRSASPADRSGAAPR